MTAFGTTIKPIGRTINAKGDTITLFSIQSEREIVYNLQVGNEKALQLKSLQAVDSALTAQNYSLKEKADLLQAKLDEVKKESNLWMETAANCTKENQKKTNEIQKLKGLNKILIITTVTISSICIVFILAR